MNPQSPYSLPSLNKIGSQDVFGSWLVQPYQLNSAGNLPGATTINVNGQGVQISGPTSSIILSNTTTQKAVISLLGNKGYILYTNPTSTINQMVEGTLPDGTTGLVCSISGVDVLNIFS